MIPAYWCNSSNFGDAVMPWIYEQVSGNKVFHCDPTIGLKHVLLGGSILNWASDTSSVWGAGLASLADQVTKPAAIHAVRGPLSRLKAQYCNIECPAVYGDPALLLPRYYNPDVPKAKHGVGFFPHYVDLARAHIYFPKGVKIIDPLQPWRDVIKDVLACDRIYSTALHGLIVADAYGIPNQWVEVDGKVGGDRLKFRDYLSSVGRDTPTGCRKPLDWVHEKSKVDLNARCDVADENVVLGIQGDLIAECPREITQ